MNMASVACWYLPDVPNKTAMQVTCKNHCRIKIKDYQEDSPTHTTNVTSQNLTLDTMVSERFFAQNERYGFFSFLFGIGYFDVK